MPCYAFGPFSLDPEARVLMREGAPVPIAGKTMDTLLLLVQNRGQLVDKDELLSRIWAGSVVEEANLTQSISTVRKVLGDSPKEHRYIATVAGRGYQFVAPVTEVKDETPQRAPEPNERHPFWRRNRLMLLGLMTLLVGVTAAVWFTLRHPTATPTELVERQLTFNSGASAVISVALSGDDKYLAYSDPAGIHARLLGTGEERTLPTPAGISASALFHVDSWFPDGTQLLIDSEQPGGRGSMWIISLMGQSLRELRTDSKGWSVSPDGSLIAFSPSGKWRELWLMDSRGEGAKRILQLPANEWLYAVHWSPEGQRLAYIRMRATDTIIETSDLKGTNRTTLVAIPKSADWLADICWLSDTRIVYALQEDYGQASSFWQVAVGTHSRRAAGKPRRITHWIGSGLLGLSAGADGKRLLLLKGQIRTQAYLGEVVASGKRMNPPRLLSSNEAEDSPTAWTADSKSVLFASNRNGKWGIFKQAITEISAEPLVTGLEFVNLPRLSPDGTWVLYMESLGSGVSGRFRLMRVPLNRGLPQFVFELRNGRFDFSCARAPANFCTIFEESADQERFGLTAVDPMKGRGKLLRNTHAGNFASGLAPDGSTFAMAKREEADTHIKLLSLTGGSDREIVLKSWPRIAGLDWSADGKGLYCGFASPQGGTLVYVELNGTTHVLWHSSEVGVNAFLGGIPSPDDRYLAIWGGVNSKNVWMLEGF
jgi:eukaryotic-like serine/threonine-protein kinase